MGFISFRETTGVVHEEGPASAGTGCTISKRRIAVYIVQRFVPCEDRDRSGPRLRLTSLCCAIRSGAIEVIKVHLFTSVCGVDNRRGKSLTIVTTILLSLRSWRLDLFFSTFNPQSWESVTQVHIPGRLYRLHSAANSYSAPQSASCLEQSQLLPLGYRTLCCSLSRCLRANRSSEAHTYSDLSWAQACVLATSAETHLRQRSTKLPLNSHTSTHWLVICLATLRRLMKSF